MNLQIASREARAVARTVAQIIPLELSVTGITAAQVVFCSARAERLAYSILGDQGPEQMGIASQYFYSLSCFLVLSWYAPNPACSGSSDEVRRG